MTPACNLRLPTFRRLVTLAIVGIAVVADTGAATATAAAAAAAAAATTTVGVVGVIMGASLRHGRQLR